MKNLSNIIILLTLTCVTIIPVSSQATDKDGNFAIWGKGNKSCHNYNISRNTDEEQRFKDYIMGFLTAFNVQMPETYRVSGNMNLDEILAWLDDYCQLKPVISFEQSLSDFIIENRDKRMKRSPSKYRR
ncbi:MAG: hypothetical protein IIC11_03790 [Proteobacteria bacterium]|nr:hypothetical protein [Pseudomonadota bacterium]